MKKKILLFSALILVLTGCSSKEEDPMVVLCDKVDGIVEEYRTEAIDEDEFIDKVLELESECTTDDYLCTEITAFKMLNSNLKKELFDAHANELDRDCQLIREKYQK